MSNTRFCIAPKEEKKAYSYVALIHKQEGTCFGVMFPDFPGCISAGETLEEAFDNAREALALHAKGLRQEGKTIPAPRLAEDIKDAKEDWIDFDGAIATLVPLTSYE